MVYGYIRVSTDKQTVENQRYEIKNFCKKNNMKIDGWILDEGISGTKDPEKRELGKLLTKAKSGDYILCSELSRLGRSLMMIMSILNECSKKKVNIWTIKDNYRLDNDISSAVIAFAYGLSAQIERQLISQRTKEALARKKAEGVVLGRPKGHKSAKTKLTGKEEQIIELLENNISYSAIGRLTKVHRLTVASFVKRHNLKKE
ncbi:master DNA invertase Mpi family serine-type recombinase [uncultured Capnocytophaga sp.]|uniref:master DNA invertase Mpi family serine-type recombinase n=1 Tax=uncultured Capnocytophaga sp. TaxID=159273 RepID=UPI002593797C|nr:master DNA invertase Mpi family serine-type recombinase [uncultured Capnocytophaga sp.]